MRAAVTVFLALFTSFVVRAVGRVHTTYFDFPSFSPLPNSVSFEEEGFALEGSVELNVNTNYSYGRAVHSKPVHLWDNKTANIASFSTRFSFSIFRQPKEPGYADGMVFFLAPVGYDIPNNSRGSGFTIFQEDEKSPAVAVEFDTFAHEIDSIAPHVGIDVGSAVSKNSMSWDPFDGGYNFTSEAVITYDNASMTLNASFTRNSGNGVMLSYSFDLRKALPEIVTIGFAATTGRFFERHVIHSWSFSSSLELDEDGPNSKSVEPALSKSSTSARKKSIAVIAGGVSGGLSLAIAGAVLAWLLLRRTSCGRVNDEVVSEKELIYRKWPRSFSYSELARATRNFAPEEKLGRGGFGFVYKGKLRNPEMVVAVKRVAADSRQGKKEYVAEVNVISGVRHRNLVRLVGWCHGRGELLLVYEFMPNGSLDAHLYGSGEPLPWPTRYRIAKGVASALLYLHDEWEQCVVHRDVKASNVMLDAEFNAKLGDFGLARLMDHGSSMQTTAVAGTLGYMAPEVGIVKASTKSDVYSYGILALEIASGRRPFEISTKDAHLSLVEWVWYLYENGSALEAADPRLGEDFAREEMERLMAVGLWCAHPIVQERPSMSQIIGVLLYNMPIPNIPPHPPSEPSVFMKT